MESKEMINLVLLAAIILISGMVLWKISSLLTKGKRRPKGSKYFSTKMKDKYNKM